MELFKSVTLKAPYIGILVCDIGEILSLEFYGPQKLFEHWIQTFSCMIIALVCVSAEMLYCHLRTTSILILFKQKKVLRGLIVWLLCSVPEHFDITLSKHNLLKFACMQNFFMSMLIVNKEFKIA